MNEKDKIRTTVITHNVDPDLLDVQIKYCLKVVRVIVVCKTYLSPGQSPWPCIWAFLCCAQGGERTGTPARSAAGLWGWCQPETSGPSGFPESPELHPHRNSHGSYCYCINRWSAWKVEKHIFCTYFPRPVSDRHYSLFSLQLPFHWSLCWPEIWLCIHPKSRDLWTK